MICAAMGVSRSVTLTLGAGSSSNHLHEQGLGEMMNLEYVPALQSLVHAPMPLTGLVGGVDFVEGLKRFYKSHLAQGNFLRTSKNELR